MSDGSIAQIGGNKQGGVGSLSDSEWEKQRYQFCKLWIRAGKGTPDQLERYRQFVRDYELRQAGAESPPAQTLNLFDQAVDDHPAQPAEDLPQLATDPDPGPVAASRYPDSVKIWPVVGLVAINGNSGGAWRLWALCHALDSQGSGRALISDLLGWLAELGVGDRKRRRWIRAALELGLIRAGGDYYYLAGLAGGAVALGCMQIGAPAKVAAVDLLRSGWRAVVWGAYIATLHGRPISQDKKYELTGVDPRTQRNYQASVPGGHRRNYARTNTPGDHCAGLKDNGRPGAFVGRDGKIVDRLPDIRTTPGSVAQLANRDRSRKAQKKINFLFIVEREQDQILRLFHDTAKGVKAALRRIARADLSPSESPGEVYELIRAGRSVNLWRPVAVDGVMP